MSVNNLLSKISFNYTVNYTISTLGYSYRLFFTGHRLHGLEKISHDTRTFLTTLEKFSRHRKTLTELEQFKQH